MKLIFAAIALAFAGIAGSASAATFTYYDTIRSPNECGRGGFDACSLFGSPTIAKAEFRRGVVSDTELNNTVFPSLDGDEFSVSLRNNRRGTWSFEPGAGDPTVVSAFVVKAGRNYSIFTWDPSSGTDFSNISWNTATLRGRAASHITIFGDGFATIPLPAAGGLLLTGLGALFVMRRRRKS